MDNIKINNNMPSTSADADYSSGDEFITPKKTRRNSIGSGSEMALVADINTLPTSMFFFTVTRTCKEPACLACM